MQWITLATALLGCSTVIAVPTAAWENHALQKRAGSRRVKSIICDKHPINPDDFMKDWGRMKDCAPSKVGLGADCSRAIFPEIDGYDSFTVTLYVRDTTMINRPGVIKELTILDIKYDNAWYDGASADLSRSNGKCQWHH